MEECNCIEAVCDADVLKLMKNLVMLLSQVGIILLVHFQWEECKRWSLSVSGAGSVNVRLLVVFSVCKQQVCLEKMQVNDFWNTEMLNLIFFPHLCIMS